MLQALNVSDKIQVISIVASTLLSFISVTIAVTAIYQTNKITKESNKPYIVPYLTFIHIHQKFDVYLVVKNFGKTGATIKSVECITEMDMVKFDRPINRLPLQHLKNHFIAPDQSYTDFCEFETPYKDLTIKVSYEHDSKIYNDTFSLNYSAARSGLLPKTLFGNNNDLDLKDAIGLIAHEHFRQNL